MSFPRLRSPPPQNAGQKKHQSQLNSGKEKAHKHKQIFPVTARWGGGLPTGWGGGGLPTGGQGSKVYVLCAEPKEHKHFRPGTRPGGFLFPAGRIGDLGDREIVYVPNVYAPFPAPTNIPSTPKCLQYKKILRWINFVKITTNIFQRWSRIWPLLFCFCAISTRLPEERMGVTKKNRCHNEFP